MLFPVIVSLPEVSEDPSGIDWVHVLFQASAEHLRKDPLRFRVTAYVLVKFNSLFKTNFN